MSLLQDVVSRRSPVCPHIDRFNLFEGCNFILRQACGVTVCFEETSVLCLPAAAFRPPVPSASLRFVFFFQHWLQLHIKPAVLVQRLTLFKYMRFERGRPTEVVVLGGAAAGSLAELRTVQLEADAPSSLLLDQQLQVRAGARRCDGAGAV